MTFEADFLKIQEQIRELAKSATDWRSPANKSIIRAIDYLGCRVTDPTIRARLEGLAAARKFAAVQAQANKLDQPITLGINSRDCEELNHR